MLCNHDITKRGWGVFTRQSSCKHHEWMHHQQSWCVYSCVCFTCLANSDFSNKFSDNKCRTECGKLIQSYFCKYHLCTGHNISWSYISKAVRGQLHCNLMRWWLSSMVIYCSCTKCLLRKVDTGELPRCESIYYLIREMWVLVGGQGSLQTNKLTVYRQQDDDEIQWDTIGFHCVLIFSFRASKRHLDMFKCSL